MSLFSAKQGAILRLLSVLCLLFPTVSAADDSVVSQTLANRFELAYQVMHLEYEEPGIMKEHGWLHGVRAKYSHYFDNGLMLRAEGDVLGAGMRYEGRYSDGTSLETNTDDYLIEARGLAGYTFYFERFSLTPYTGFGYRYWNDTIRCDGGYERVTQYYYLPVGFEVVSKNNNGWEYGLQGEFDGFLGGRNDSYLSDAGAGYEDVSMTQRFGYGYGLRGSVFAGYGFDTFFLQVEPFFQYWNVEQSKIVAGRTPSGTANWREPKNHTKSIGLLFSVGF